MMEFRTGGAQVVIPGIRVVQAGGGAVAWWQVAGQTCVAAYQPKGAASLAASYVNLATPGTFDAAPGVAPTFDAATGWTFNGTTQYLVTGVVPSLGMSVIVRHGASTSSALRAVIGSQSFTQGLCLLPRATATGRRYRGAGELVIAQATGAGIIALTSYNTGTPVGYFNGVADGNVPLASVVGTLQDLVIGATRSGSNGSTLDNFWTSTIQALAIYSTTLDAAQVAALTTRMNLL